MSIIAIIPARGGSKGIKGKNLKKIGKASLIQHAIHVAQESGIFSHIIVNSDNDKILAHARLQQGVLEYKRPSACAQDSSTMAEVLTDFFQNWTEPKPQAFMLLEPTCPFRTVAHLHQAVLLLKQPQTSCVVSVCPPFQHPNDCVIQHDGIINYALSRKQDTRGRQDFKETFFINGAIYLTALSFFEHTGKVYDLEKARLLMMPQESGIDIDTEFDLMLARSYYTLSRKKNRHE